MFGFGKKKKAQGEDAKSKDKTEQPEASKPPSGEEAAPDAEKTAPPAAKKRSIVKLVLISVLVLLAVLGSAAVVYFFYFAPKSAQNDVPVYNAISFEHVALPEEIVKFSFDYLPDIYHALVSYDREMVLMDKEIARIDEIGQRYIDQKKIADKEKKIWEKTRSTLQKSFIKIEKPVKETYVLFRVNQAAGLDQVRARYPELVEKADTALSPAQELTEKLKSKESVPAGLIKGTVYKLKKKFL